MEINPFPCSSLCPFSFAQDNIIGTLLGTDAVRISNFATSHFAHKKPSRRREGLRTGFGKTVTLRALHCPPESPWALEQVELDCFAFIQRTIAVLLNGGEVHEHVLTRGALDESVSLRPVEPLHSPLLSHKKLLSPRS